jgi:hypothetical protein
LQEIADAQGDVDGFIAQESARNKLSRGRAKTMGVADYAFDNDGQPIKCARGLGRYLCDGIAANGVVSQ